jgi:two-component system OmpR family sensor kinase
MPFHVKSPLRRVATRLSVVIALLVAAALAVVWIALVPTLQRRLVAGRLHQLADSAKAVRREAAETGIDQDFIDEAARSAEARVVYFEPVARGSGTALFSQFDSAHFAYEAPGVESDPIALRAAASLSVQTGRVSHGGEPFAEAAVADRSGNVLLFSARLRSTLEEVGLVRSRLLWAGLAALGLAMLAGYGAATVFARRIRRLERAAERIAAGDFGEPVVDRGRDELGELAAAFDRMRLQLAQLDDARRAFIANASHELRTPIFSLGGFLELLRDEDLDEETRREFLGTMSEQVERLAKLATDLLDLSRLDAGHLRLVQEQVDVAGLAGGLSEEFAAVALRLEHPLETLVEAEGAVTADRERALQIGRILVDNALRHTPPGTPVRVVARGTSLAVEDEGPGIPDEHREQVFARFTRLAGRRSSGTGLGLAIARELAQRMGGEVRLDSVPGRTVFTLELPAAVPEREAAGVV